MRRHLFATFLAGFLAVASGHAQDIALLDQKAIVQQGTHFGTDLEKVNLLTGQLNVALPLYAAEGRGAQPAGFPMGLVYNSGLWQMQGGVVSHDFRLFAVGWQLHAGSLKQDSSTQYTYTDGGGARHRLFCSGVCTGKGPYTYLSQDSTYLKLIVNDIPTKLYLRGGSFWYFGGFSSPYASDSGTRYPTLFQDTNGNQITLSYSNLRPFGGCSSTVDFAVFSSVQTPRNRTFSVTWNGAWYSLYRSPGVVTAAGDQVATGSNYTSGTDLVSPFSTPESGQPFFGCRLTSLTLGDPAPLSGAATRTYTFQYNTSGEMTKIILPEGGYFRYSYDNLTVNGKTIRVITNRYVSPDGTAANEQQYTFTYTAASTDSNPTQTVVGDVISGVTQTKKVYSFLANNTGTEWKNGLQSQLQIQQWNGASYTTLRTTATTWTQDTPAQSAQSNPRPSVVTTTLENGQQSRREMDVDGNGNTTAVREFGYDGLLYRRTAWSYLADPAYLNLNINNRPTNIQVYDAAGNSVSQVTIQYDTYTTEPLLDCAGIALHDAAYGATYTTRGNATRVTRNGLLYRSQVDIGGNARSTTDPAGHQVSAAHTENASDTHTAPESITDPATTTSLSYMADMSLSQVTEPNSNVTTVNLYDALLRPLTITRQDGGTTTYVYSATSVQETTKINATLNKVVTRVLDGLGRVKQVKMLLAI